MKKRVLVWSLLAASVVVLSACGKKQEAEPQKTESVEEEEKKVTQEDTDFSFLNVMGQDCQMLPGDVDVETTEMVVIATAQDSVWLGGAEGTLSYKYETQDPYIREITWTAAGCEVDALERIRTTLIERYEDPDLTDEAELEEGSGRSYLYTWKNADGCMLRVGADENPTNGANITLTWKQIKEDDLGFISYLGQSIDQLPQDKLMDLGEGEEGLLLLMNENYIAGINGSASFYYTKGEDVIRKVSWESTEITEEEGQALLDLFRDQYGEPEVGIAEEGEHPTYRWTDNNGSSILLTILTYDSVRYAHMIWQ